MRLVAMLLVLASVSLHAQGSRTRIAVAGHHGTISVDSIAGRYPITASRAATFHAAAQAMLELNIKPATRDSLRGTVGIANLAQRGTFARKPIRQFLDCGSGILGANADNWRVYITAYAYVERGDSSTTTLRVAIIGGARDTGGVSTAAVACASTGAFEAMFADRVRTRIATGAP